MIKHQELIARLEGGETGREIDEAVFLAFNEAPSGPGWKKTSAGNWHRFLGPLGHWDENVHADSVSTSLDAAVALVERVRPGWLKSLEEFSDGDAHYWVAELVLERPDGKLKPLQTEQGTAPTPAAALLAALLKSVEG